MSPDHNNTVSDSNGLQKLKKEIKLRNQINPFTPTVKETTVSLVRDTPSSLGGHLSLTDNNEGQVGSLCVVVFTS